MRLASVNVLEIGLQKSILFIYMVGELLLKYFLALQFSLKDELEQKMRWQCLQYFYMRLSLLHECELSVISAPSMLLCRFSYPLLLLYQSEAAI
jgi:hypothetical protein